MARIFSLSRCVDALSTARSCKQLGSEGACVGVGGGGLSLVFASFRRMINSGGGFRGGGPTDCTAIATLNEGKGKIMVWRENHNTTKVLFFLLAHALFFENPSHTPL